MQEIPLPDNDFGMRIHAGHGVVRFVAAGGFHACRPALKTVGVTFSLLFALIPLAGYIFAAQANWDLSPVERFAFHTLFGGFGLLFLISMTAHTLDSLLFSESSLSRPGGEQLELEYRRGGRRKIYKISPPATVIFLLNLDSGRAMHIRYCDSTRVALLLTGAQVSPHMPLLAKGWLQLSPHQVLVIHENHEPEANLQQTLKALQPLAVTMRDQLHLPVEFQIAGGKVVARIETIHAA